MQSLYSADGRARFGGLMPQVTLSRGRIEGAERVSVTAYGVVQAGRGGMRRLPVRDAAQAATAVLLRQWKDSVRAERLGIALAVATQSGNASGLAEVAQYGVPFADPNQPVSYYRNARATLPPSPVAPNERALVEAEAAANELAFVTCTNVFDVTQADVDSIFDVNKEVVIR